MRQRDWLYVTDHDGDLNAFEYMFIKVDRNTRKGIHGNKITYLELKKANTDKIVALFNKGSWDVYPFDNDAGMQAVKYLVDTFSL